MRLSEFAEDPDAVRQANRLAAGILEGEVVRGRMRANRMERRVRRTTREFEAMSPGEMLESVPDWTADVALEPVVLLGSAIVVGTEGRDRPALLMNRDRLKDAPEFGAEVAVSEVREAVESLRALDVGDVNLERVMVLAVPPPLPQWAPGERVSSGAMRGTLGVAATMHDGSSVITTAGHAAPSGSVVKDSSGRSGDVVFSLSPSAIQPNTPVADIALIRPHSDRLKVGLDPTSLGTIAGPCDVRMRGAESGEQVGAVMGLSDFLVVDAMAGMWASVAFTGTAISAPGDSGAPVTAEGADDSLLGHLVGGAEGFTSWIQTADVQFRAANIQLGAR